MECKLELLLGVNLYGFYLHHLSHKLKCFNDEQLRPYGITGQQARVLSYIAFHQEDDFFCQKHLEEELHLKGSSVTSVLHGLERGGFIRRITGDRDGRTKKMLLTEKGEKTHNTFNQIIVDGEQKLIEGLTPEEQDTLYFLLKKMATAKGER